jgi:hypothetical protein
MFRYTSVLLLGFILGSSWSAPYKSLIRALYAEEYGRLVYLCDSAMREHYVAKNALLENASESTLEDVSIAEIALLDCQTYDILRKKLISYGLNENDLSLISLQFIEKYSSDLIDVVEIHEINY